MSRRLRSSRRIVEVLGELADAGEVGLLCPGQEGEEAQVVGEAD